MKQYSTYIFDLDGTLLDTLSDLRDATNHALRLSDMPERSLEEIRHSVGNGVRLLIERAVPEGTPAELTDRVFDDFRQYYLVHSMDTTAPYDGIMPMLAELSRRGKRMAVVSNKLHEATNQLVSHFFGQYITVAIGESSGVRRKPAPDTVEEAFRCLGVDKTDAVYVGDSDVDFQTARNSGLPCISVLWGFRDRDFLAGLGADCFIEKPEELLR